MVLHSSSPLHTSPCGAQQTPSHHAAGITHCPSYTRNQFPPHSWEFHSAGQIFSTFFCHELRHILVVMLSKKQVYKYKPWSKSKNDNVLRRDTKMLVTKECTWTNFCDEVTNNVITDSVDRDFFLNGPRTWTLPEWGQPHWQSGRDSPRQPERMQSVNLMLADI